MRMTGLVAAASVMIGAALAGATAVRAAPPEAAPAVYHWTGWYIGVNGGVGRNGGDAFFAGDYPEGAGSGVLHSAANLPPLMTAPTAVSTYSQELDQSGFIGGGQIGYNWQVGPAWLLGIEADIQHADLAADAYFGVPPAGGVSYSITSAQSLKWFGTVRGRLGLLINPQLHAFVTGGFAYGETGVDAAITNISGLNHNFAVSTPTQLFCAANAVCLADSSSKVSTGWTFGGGIEFAPWRNVSIKLEYLHVDLGDQTLTLVARAPATGNGFVTAHFDNSYDIFRAGVNFRY